MIEDCAHDTRTWQRRTSYLQLDNHLGVYGNISNIFKQRAIFLKKKEKKCDARAQHTRIHVNIHIQYIYIYTQGAREQRVSVKIYEESSRVESSRVDSNARDASPSSNAIFSPRRNCIIYISNTNVRCVVECT